MTGKSNQPLFIRLKFDRATKNTLKYDEDFPPGTQPILRNLYLSKAAASLLGDPPEIRVSISLPE